MTTLSHTPAEKSRKYTEYPARATPKECTVLLAPEKCQGLLLALSSPIFVRRSPLTISIVLALICCILTDTMCMAGTSHNSGSSQYLITHDTNTLLSPLFVEDESERLSLPLTKRAIGMFILFDSFIAHQIRSQFFGSKYSLRKSLSMSTLVRLRI